MKLCRGHVTLPHAEAAQRSRPYRGSGRPGLDEAGPDCGKYEQGKSPSTEHRFGLGARGFKYNEKYWTDLDLAAVARLKQIAADHGKRLAQFALAWVLNKPGITAIVCGTTSVEQLDQNLGAVGMPLSQEEVEACDQVWHTLHPPRLFYGR